MYIAPSLIYIFLFLYKNKTQINKKRVDNQQKLNRTFYENLKVIKLIKRRWIY